MNTLVLVNEAGYDTTITLSESWCECFGSPMRKGIDVFGVEYREYAAPLIGRWWQAVDKKDVWTEKR